MQNDDTLSSSKVDRSPSDVPISTVTLHVGGPSSRRVPFPIIPLEAALLARHWVREIIEYDHRRGEQGAECPPGWHVREYASLRLEDLEASGLLSRDDVNLLSKRSARRCNSRRLTRVPTTRLLLGSRVTSKISRTHRPYFGRVDGDAAYPRNQTLGDNSFWASNMRTTQDCLTQVLRKLDGVRETQKESWTARCPAHDDSTPSLSVSVGDNGAVVLHCHAGCTFDEICAALQVRPADLFPRPTASGKGGRSKRSTVYEYTDESGTLLFRILRFDHAGGKSFIQQRPKSDRSGWINNLNGVG
jgi:hypothetical protein